MKSLYKLILLSIISLLSFLSPTRYRITGDTAALNACITNCMDEYHLPGVVTAMVHRDDLVWQKAYRYRDLEQQINFHKSYARRKLDNA